MSLIFVAGIPLWVLLILVSGVTGKKSSSGTDSKSLKDVQWHPVESTVKPKLTWTSDGNSGFTLKGIKSRQYTAVIVSDELKFNNKEFCLSFSKQIVGPVYGTLQVAVAKDLSSQKEILWWRAENIHEWGNVTVPISSKPTDGFIVIVTGFLADGKKDSIFVKNLSIKEGKCLASRRDDTPLCDFQEGVFCGWTENGNWEIVEGPERVEIVSHNRYTRNLNGRYAIANVISQQDTASFTLTSPTLQGGNKKQCLRLYYLLSGGVESGTFTTKVVKGDGTVAKGETSRFFHVSGAQGTKWREALIDVDESSNYKIVIEYTPGKDMTIMAIDDITIVNGACPLINLDGDITCSMDNTKSECIFASVAYLGQKFEIGKMPSTSLPTGTTAGKVATYTLEKKNPDQWSIAYLTSKIYSTNSRTNCLTFYYSIKSTNATFLRFYTSSNLRHSEYKWERMFVNTNGWRKGMVEFETMKNYKIEFAAVISKSATGSVEIGSYQLANSACPKESTDPYMCSFDEKTICGWETPNNNGLAWTRRTGVDTRPGTGPKTDHDTYSRTGHYMLFDTSDRKEGDYATLRSPQFQAATESSDYCLSFWYSMAGQNMGPLKVYVRKEGATASEKQLVWELQRNRYHAFVYAQANVPANLATDKFRIEFFASVGSNKVDIGIDDVNFEKGACPNYF